MNPVSFCLEFQAVTVSLSESSIRWTASRRSPVGTSINSTWEILGLRTVASVGAPVQSDPALTSWCKSFSSPWLSFSVVFPSCLLIGYPLAKGFSEILMTSATAVILLLTEKNFRTLGCVRTARDFLVFLFSSRHFEVLELPWGCGTFVSATGTSAGCDGAILELASCSRRFPSSRWSATRRALLGFGI